MAKEKKNEKEKEKETKKKLRHKMYNVHALNMEIKHGFYAHTHINGRLTHGINGAHAIQYSLKICVISV